MADKVTNTTEETTAIPSPEAMVPSSGKFTFESVDDLLLPPNTPEFTELMSPEYNAMLKRHANQINSYSPPAIGNLNNPNPTLATNTYDPYSQTNGLDLSTPEGKLQSLSTIGMTTKPTEEVKIEDPIYAGIRASNFDRYYNHPEFSNLGWHPYANNEEYYNANSTIWDDLARSSVQFAKLATTGFLSAYRSIGDLFDSDDYFTGKDLDSAREFSDAMRIGNSTRGGAPQFLNNLFLQSGYTFGVIGSIAVEELALWGAAALQGGLNPVSDAAAVTRTGYNIARLGKTIANTFDLGRLTNATRNMYRGLRSADKAKDAYTAFKNGGRFIGDIIAPETAQAIRTLNSTKNGVQNLSNMAKASATFGGFYRDLRSLNLALSESKMEGGMVYDQQIANGYALQTQLNKGEPITTEQMENIVEKAARASYYTTLLNAPTIYLSNQLVLGNAFGAYNRSLSRMLRDNIDGVGRRIIKTEGSRPFMDVGEGVRGYLKRMKNAGAKGSAKMAAQASLRYFSANLSEGLQELTQEAIAHGTKDYFTTLLKDPAAGGYYTMMGTLGSAVGSQFSAQGFETFMSGFLMGGLVQGPQKLFFQGVPALYQKKFQKEKYELYKAEKKKYIDNLVTAMNDTYEVTATNPMESLFDTAKNNLVIQKQAGVDMLQAAFDSSNLDFVDAKDFSKFQAIYAILANNQAGEFRQQFEDYLKLSDEELAEAFPSFKKDIKSGKLRQRAQDMITQIDSLEDSYHANKDKFVNPFDPDVYKYGSRQWNDENIKRKAFEHARYLYMFTEDGFKRALERSQTIFDELSAEPLFGKQAASDITVLLDEKSINKEIMILAAEISTLDPKENKDIINAKTKKLEGLRGIVDVLYADENLTKDGFFDRRKINKLRAPFEKYLNNLAKSKDTFVDAKKVDGAISKLVDYKTLQGRAVAYNKSIEYLNNPARFEEIYQRSYEFLKSVYKNRVKIFRDSVENYVGKQEINQFLNELAKLDIYPDPQQVKEFMDTGNIDELVNFYTEDGLVDPIGDEKLFNEIQALKNAYKQAVTPEVTEETEQEQAESRERRGLEADLQKILDQNQIGEEAPAVKVFGINKNSNPVVKRVLKDKYEEYVQNQVTLNNDNILEPDQWRDTEGQKYLFANEALKKIWYDDLTNQGQEITDQDFNNDVGFEEWLKDQQDNPVVKNLLYEAEITLSDFVEIEPSVEIPEVQEPEIKGEIAVGKRMKMSDDYTSVNILQSSATDDTGNIKPIYKVVGKKGEEISQELLQAAGLEDPLGQTPNQIEEKAKKLDDVSIATKPFLFAGVEMSYGTTVTDSKGNRFVVIGTEGGKLSILDIKKIKEGLSKKDKEKLASKVTEAQFKAKYKLEEIDFIKLPKDVSRLQLDEFVDVYPYQHNKFSNNPEPIKDSRTRLQLILENLTPEERNNLSIIIERNAEGGILKDKKFQTRNSDGNMRPSNPYIETVREPFKIGLAFGSTETQDRISKELDKKGIKPYYGTGGVFGFLSSGSVELLNEKGDPVNPLNITKEILENTFTIYPRQKATAVEDVANNYAVQQGLLDRISELIKDGDKINLTLKDLPGFYFNASSKVKFDENNPKSPNDLTYNTVDGVKVIMVNDRLKDGRISTTYITDIKDPAKKREFRQKLEEGINLQHPNLYNTFQNSQRYVMVIKTPNGQFAGAGLVAAKLSQEEIDTLDRELAAQGIKTINENLTGSGPVQDKKIKDVNINNDFNEKFNKKLYITTNKRGFSIEINVSSDGTFRADIYDKSKKTKEGVAYFGGRQQTLDLEGKESPGIIKRLISEIDKGIKKEKERLEKEKKELPEWVKLKVSLENVRTSFPADPEIDVILNNTTTKVGKDVRTNYKLTLSADDNIVQESKAVITTVDNFSKEPEVEQEPSPTEIPAEIAINLERREEESVPAYVDRLIDGGFLQDVEGKYFFELSGRLGFIVNINGIKLPFYQSTAGTSGKVKGHWYPFFGNLGDWIIKGSIKGEGGMLNGYGIQSIRDVQTFLNDNFKELDALYTNMLPRGVKRDMVSWYRQPENLFKGDQRLSLNKEETARRLASILGYTVEEGLEIKTDRELFELASKQVLSELAALTEPAPIKKQEVPKVTTERPEVTDIKSEIASKAKKIEELENEIYDDKSLPNLQRIAKAKADPEIKKLKEELKQLKAKLIANKLLNKNLTNEDITDIEEFSDWASKNLPDFITIADIKNLKDNLVYNGVRVGAFALSMNDIAGGLKIKGTIYTGASNPFKYHEAFHAVFRTLLTNEQQDRLYVGAKKDVKKKYGAKYAEELEMFKNSADKYRAMGAKALEREFLEEYMADEFEKFKKNPRSTKAATPIKNFFNKLMEWLKALFGAYSPNELQNLFREIDSGKFKSASPINNRFTDSLATGITVNANKIIPVDFIESDSGQFGYRVLDNATAKSIVNGITARVVQLELDNKKANFNVEQAVDDSFSKFRALYSTRREAYNNVELTNDQLRSLMDIEKAFAEYGDSIKENVYEQLKFYEIKSTNIEEANEEDDANVGDRVRLTDQYDKDVTSIGGFSSLSTFLRKYIGTTSLYEKDQFGNDYLIDPELDANGKVVPGTGEKLMVTVDFATAYNGFLKAVKNISDPIKILQRMYLFGISNPQTKAVVDKLFNDLGIKWEGQLENGELPQYTTEVIEKFKAGEPIPAEELTQGMRKPLLFQAVLKGFENARVDYLFVHRTEEGRVVTYSAAKRDDAHTQIDRWGQAYLVLSKKLKTDEGVRKDVVDKLDELLDYLQYIPADEEKLPKKTVEEISDQQLQSIAAETSEVLFNNVGIYLHPKFIEYSIVKNVVNLEPYQKALLNANSDEKALDYNDIYRIKLIIENNGDPFTTTDEGAKNRLNRIALGNAAFDENVGASVFKNPNGDFVYAHQLPTFHLKKIQQLNDVGGEGSTIEQLKTDRYLANNLLVNDPAFKRMSADGTLRVLRISGSKKGNIDVNEDGMMSETSGKTPTSGKTYGDSTPREFILNLINAYTYGVDTLSGKVRSVVWENEDGTINKEAIAPVLMRVLEASNTGDMLPLPVKKAVEKLKGETVISDITLNSIFNNIKAEFERIQRESNPETATQELIVGFNALAERNEETGTDYIVPIDVASSNVDKGRAFNFNKTGVLLNPLGKKKESRKGVVILQTSEAKVNRVKEGKQKSLIYSQENAEKYIGFTTTGVTRKAIVKTKESKEGVSVTIKSKGLVKVTPENRDAIYTALEGSWSAVKTDQYKYEAKVEYKNKITTFYVESRNERDFLQGGNFPQGGKSMYMYDIIQAGDIESDIEVDFKTTGYEDTLLDAARSPENKDLTFEESLEKANISKDDLLSFIRFRLNQEFDQFNILLDELIKSDDLGNFITNGILTSSGASNANTQRSNNLLNLIPKDTDYNLKQIFFNDYINTTAINQILLGDTAYTLNDAVDEIKRAKMQNAAYYSAASSIAAPAYGIYKPLQEFSLFSMTEPYAKSTYNKGVTKVADAQLYMTTKAFRNFQFGFGKLTASQAELFDKIERGEDIDPDEFFGTADTSGYISRKEMLNSQKLVYGDGRSFVKMSAFPLLPQFTSIKDKDGNYTIPKPNKVALHNLRVKLERFEAENDTVATAAPLTALKMLKQNVSDIYKMTGTETALTVEQSTTLDANFLGLQVINPSNKTVITDPSQIKSLVTSEQDDKTEVFINGEETTVGKIRAAYHKATRDRGNLNYISKRNLVFTFDVGYAMDELQKSIKENEITADLYTYLKYAEASLASTGSSSHLMELFSLNENGEQKYNLNNPLTQTKFMNLFMSYFSKSVFREKIPGATVALVSDYGVRVYRRVFSVDENGMPDRHEIITEKQFEATRPTIELNIDEGSYPGNDDSLASLKSRVEKSKGKGVVIIDRLRNGLKEYDKEGKHTGQRYGEMMMPSHHKEVMQELELQGKSIPEVVGKMFAVRIPSQDNHSTYNVKWVDFMPAAYGSSAVFAREIVEISGADFDIDKVFMQFKEFYNKGGEFFEYGKQTEEKARYQDYARYVNEKVKDSQSVYGEALYKYKGRGTTNSLTDADIKEAVKLGMSRDSIDALSVLSLPRTLEEYKAYTKDKKHEPYTAALNNDILDYKFALMGNNHVTEKQAGIDDAPISYKAADIKVLKDLWEELKVELPILEELSKEEGIDVDNLFGKVRMFANNKEGARSIGAVVLPNLYLNLLEEFDIKIQSEGVAGREIASEIEFKVANLKPNEKPFPGFERKYERLEDGTKGQRTQYIISALITAATDNAKERLLAKLGLNINALSVVANLTALGVPIKTSILLVNHPVIRQAYFQEANAPEDAPVKAVKVVKNRIKDLQTTFLEDTEKNIRVVVSQKLLSDAIANELIAPKATIKDMKEIREEGGISKMDVATEISILEQFVNAADLANTTRHMGDLLNLSSGIGQGIEAIDKRHEAIEELGLNLTDKEYALLKEKPMVDVRKIFKGNTWQAGYLERFEEFTNILLPKVVLSTTPLFKEITNAITKQTSYRVLPYEQRNKFRAQLQKDLLSYLTIKAYQYNGLVTQSQTTATLTNDLIYDQEGVENITQVVGRLRDLFKEKGATNYFLDSFVVVEGSKDINNKSGINIAGANTFLKYNDTQKLDIQNGFMELYADPVTRYDAMAIVHYMMVKDGLQFAYKSLVEAVAPIALDKYLSHINTVQVAMTRPTDTVFKSTFGLNVADLVEDFTKGYLTSAPNAYILKKVKASRYKPNAKNVKVATSPHSRTLAANNPDTIYVFGDNKEGRGIRGDMSVKELDNAVGLVIKKNYSTQPDSYFTDAEENDFILDFDEKVKELQNYISLGKTVVFPKNLIAAPELETFKANSKKVFEYIEDVLKESFNYYIDPTQVKGQPTALTSSQIKNMVVYVDESQETASLVVDLYKGITKVETTLNDTELREVSDVKLNKEKIKKKLEKNIKDLGKAGFRIFKTSKNRKLYDEVEFPLIVRVNVGNEYAPNYKYFELQKTQSILPEKSIINYSGFALGNYARYVEVDLKGSYNQNSIGFMFGDRPTTKYIRNLVKSIADTSKSDQSFDDFDIKYNLDNIDTTKGKPIAAGSTVEATNKGITVDGTNIKDYTVPDVDPNIEAMVEPSVDTEAVDFINDENFSIPATASVISDLENVAGGFKPPAQLKKEDLVKLTVAELDAKYPILAAWWDKNLGAETEEGKNNRNKLIENKQDPNKKFDVNDFVDFAYSYELMLADDLLADDPDKTKEDQFIEIFKCSLKP